MKYIVNLNAVVAATSAEQAKEIAMGQLVVKEQPAGVFSPKTVWDMMMDRTKNIKQEYFVVFYLDTQNSLMFVNTVSVGTLNSSLIHPREVFAPALEKRCSHIIVAHNHPSGSLEPSLEDLAITKRLQDAGKILGIEVVDHVLVTDNNYKSFKESNLM